MKQHGPWEIKSSEVKYKNPWIEVREDNVVRPDGKGGIYGVVNMKDGVSILALDNDGNVYLTEEFQYAIGRPSIEAVSGGVDAGEALLVAAKRELKEETGLEADTWTDLGSVEPFTSVVKSSVQLYLAQNLREGTRHQEGTETIKVKKVSLVEAVKMVLDSQIVHGQSCVLILKAAHYLGKL